MTRVGFITQALYLTKSGRMTFNAVSSEMYWTMVKTYKSQLNFLTLYGNFNFHSGSLLKLFLILYTKILFNF